MSGFRVVIPARLASTRLPNKPLVDLAGKPMVVRVWERAVASGADEVWVATDAPEVAAVVEQAGGRAITDDGRRILDIEPASLHQRVPLIIGSKKDVDLAEKFLNGEM